MKHLSILSTLLTVLLCTACTPSVNHTQLVHHFLRHLQGDTARFHTSLTFPAAEVSHYQQQVWSAWCAAVTQFDEDKLPPLTPLSQQQAHQWPLPAQLEPHAIMPFYYGTKGTQPPTGWPLFLYIHGSGPKDHEWSASYALANKFQDAPSAYFIPQIPNTGKYYRWWQKSKLFAWERLIRQSFANPDIDPNRFYIIGISEGGYGSQRLASYYADYLAAAGPMAGGEPAIEAPAENCGHIGFSLRTGAEDYTFGRDQLARQALHTFDSLALQYPGEYRHHIEVIPGYKHHIDYMPTPPWVRQFQRRLHPQHFIWIDYALDGQFRNGFYNLAVRKRATPQTNLRTRYDVHIQDNIVNITVQLVKYQATYREPKWNIPITFAQHYQPAPTGALTLYLNSQLVDLSKAVTVNINGRQHYHGKVTPSLESLITSCQCYYDPERLYPASIELTW